MRYNVKKTVKVQFDRYKFLLQCVICACVDITPSLRTYVSVNTDAHAAFMNELLRYIVFKRLDHPRRSKLPAQTLYLQSANQKHGGRTHSDQEGAHETSDHFFSFLKKLYCKCTEQTMETLILIFFCLFVIIQRKDIHSEQLT